MLAMKARTASGPSSAARRTIAEPEITPAAPAATAWRTCSGVEMPKPKHRRRRPGLRELVEHGACVERKLVLRSPVTPARATQ